MKEHKKAMVTLTLLAVVAALFSIVKLTMQHSELEDFVWIWNNSLQIAEGKKMYTDVNILTMPLAFVVEALTAVMFGDKIIVHAVNGVVLSGLVLVMLYLVHRQLGKKDTWFRVMCLTVGFILFANMYFDYNWLSILFILVICWLENKQFKNNTVKQLVIGLTVGLVVITKQNIGFTVVLATIAVCVINKKYKDICLRAVGAAVVGAITIVCLIFTGTFNDFWDLAVMGLFDFGSKNSQNLSMLLTNREKLPTTIVSNLFLLTSVIGFIYNMFKCKNKKILTVQIYWLATLIFLVPLPNAVHCYLANCIGVLATVSLMDSKTSETRLLDKFKYGKLVRYLLNFSIIPICVVTVMFVQISLSKASLNRTRYDRYDGINIEESLAEDINTVGEYLESHENAMIVDGSTAVYTYPLRRYEKYFDQMLHGNMGTITSDDLIDNIKNREETLFLVRTSDSDVFWQTDKDVITFVRENYNAIEEVGSYTVYSKQ